MAKDFYQNMQDIAGSVMKQFRQGIVVLVRTTEGPADTSKPWEPGTASQARIVLDAVVSGVKAYQVDGTQIQASDLVVVCAASVDGKLVDPNESDTILIDGSAHQIKKIEPRPAAGTPVVYAIFVAG
jgi:hypothetical protein